MCFECNLSDLQEEKALARKTQVLQVPRREIPKKQAVDLYKMALDTLQETILPERNLICCMSVQRPLFQK